MPAPACQYLPAEGEEPCQTEGFSQSTEAGHDNLWYCRKHYIQWLKDRDFLKFKVVFDNAKNDPRIKKLLQEALK